MRVFFQWVVFALVNSLEFGFGLALESVAVQLKTAVPLPFAPRTHDSRQSRKIVIKLVCIFFVKVSNRSVPFAVVVSQLHLNSNLQLCKFAYFHTEC